LVEHKVVSNIERVEVNDYIVGKHVFANLYGIDSKLLWDEEKLVKIVKNAAKKGGMTLVEVKSWKFTGYHGGVSVLALVAESHIAIHTWPDYGYATVDVYTCGAHSDPWKAFNYIVNELKPKYYIVGYADRSSIYVKKGGEKASDAVASTS